MLKAILHHMHMETPAPCQALGSYWLTEKQQERRRCQDVAFHLTLWQTIYKQGAFKNRAPGFSCWNRPVFWESPWWNWALMHVHQCPRYTADAWWWRLYPVVLIIASHEPGHSQVIGGSCIFRLPNSIYLIHRLKKKPFVSQSLIILSSVKLSIW